jgi:CubicO group peptidase (beta-lactamase class C family)
VGSSGNMQADQPYFITSVTKLFITTIMLKLRAAKQLNLEDKISKFLAEDLIQGIHVSNGIDYSNKITIVQLMSNTSGLPDYFLQKQPNGKTIASGLMNGQDEPWPLEKTLATIKMIKPKFIPGQKGKVHYSDTNYQLLGRIIENITGKRMADVFKAFIIDELNLSKTYAYEDIQDTTPAPLYYNSKRLHLPKYMSSITPEGGIVSTAKETMIFLKAFFNGHFFPQKNLAELKQWNLTFFPGTFYYGIGIQKLWTPWIVSPLKPIKEIIGHWGQSGAFAFYCPEKELYFTGTINQCSGWDHNAAVKAMLKIIKSC